MKVSYGLPTHLVDQPAEFLSAAAIGDLARAAEAAGLDAAYVTEHPFPPSDWVSTGGHHALDPLVTLAVAAAATTTLHLHTNLFVAAYRNPFLAAKGVASLDVLSGGRVILGIGAGYLQGEFEALGAPFDQRNQATDEAIVAMKAAWSGDPVRLTSERFVLADNEMRPLPVQRPHPPIWIGGNSRRAARRAVQLADGWSPFPLAPRWSGAVRTAAIASAADLGERIAELADYAEAQGRTGPFDIAFAMPGSTMSPRARLPEVDKTVAECAELAEVGVNWVTVALPGESRAAQLESLARFGEQFLPELHALEPVAALR